MPLAGLRRDGHGSRQRTPPIMIVLSLSNPAARIFPNAVIRGVRTTSTPARNCTINEYDHRSYENSAKSYAPTSCGTRRARWKLRGRRSGGLILCVRGRGDGTEHAEKQ
jgi:hypothetical protein